MSEPRTNTDSICRKFCGFIQMYGAHTEECEFARNLLARCDALKAAAELFAAALRIDEAEHERSQGAHHCAVDDSDSDLDSDHTDCACCASLRHDRALRAYADALRVEP